MPAPPILGTISSTPITLKPPVVTPVLKLPPVGVSAGSGGGVTSFPGGPPTSPAVHIFDPPDDLGPVIPIIFLINDPNSDPLDLTFEYQDSAGAYKAGTLALGSDPLTRMPAPSLSTDYRLLWDAGADLGLGTKQTVTVRLTPAKSGAPVAPPAAPPGIAATSTFHVDTTPPQPLPSNQTGPVVAKSTVVIGGDGQSGISGRFLLNSLIVQILDDKQQPIVGARVSFSVLPGSGATPITADFEEDPGTGTTTGASGYAAARVRPGINVTGPIQIRAAVVGAPQIVQIFNATIYAPKIIPNPSNPTSGLSYGQAMTMVFYYDGDGNPSTTEFLADPGRPVRIKVEATNAELDRTEVDLFSVPPNSSSNSFQVGIVPSTRDQTIQLTLSDLDQPTVRLVQTYTVQTTSNSSRFISYYPTASTKPITFTLDVVQGMDPVTHLPQLGYPGLTLATGFQVALHDDGGKTLYNRSVTSGVVGCTPPATDVLNVQWSTSNGLLSATATPGAAPVGGLATLPVPIAKPVYFTPQGPGPWNLTATINDTVQDPLAQPFNWVDSAGNPQCYEVNGLSLYVNRSFIIQLPKMELQDSATGTALTTVAAGTSVQLVATVSAYAAGKPDDLALRGMYFDGSDVATYNGLPAPFKQPNVPMTAGTSPQVKSQPLLILRGAPVLATAPALALSVLPSSWLEWVCAGVTTWLGTTPTARTRRLINGVASLQDPVPGTSPHDGFDDSVQLCSGEVMRSVADLTFLTRGGEIAVARTYRDHLGGAGILGPGWVSAFESNFDVAWPWGLRFQDGYGRLFEFVAQAVPDELYCQLNLNATIDPDHGAYEIVDRHGVSTHFNVDGSLRHIQDLNKNRTTFHYNIKGQLYEIVDPFGRSTQFTYYPDTTTPKEIRGRLQQVIGFDKRQVDYTYYPANSANGHSGNLQLVQRPAAPTMIKGVEQPNYRRSETYTYTIMAGDPRDGALRDIIDSEQVTQCTMVYTPLRQVFTQTYGGYALTLTYDPVKNQTAVTDRSGNQRSWTFAVSPYCDAATPTGATETPNGVRPGAPATITNMKHNRHGEMTWCQYPDLRERSFVYDDASIYQQSKGNMLMCQETAKGSTRTTTFIYDQRFNLVYQQSYWDGLSLRIPSYLRTHFFYDTQGNLTDISGPRTLFAVLVKNAAGGDELQWVHDQHRYHMVYNTFGLVTSIEYPNGVVAAFEYYPVATPGGAVGMATGPANGGFLGLINRDASDTPTRDIYFPQYAPMQIKTSLTFDDHGDLQTFVGPNGLRSRVDCNALRQVVQTTEGDNLTAAQVPVVHHYRYFSDGMLARTELVQPNATPLAGGALLTSDSTLNADGLPVQNRTDWNAGYTPASGTAIPAQSLYTKADTSHEDLIEAVYAPATTTPTTVMANINHDERGLPFHETLSPGQDPLTFQYDFGLSGAPGTLSEPGGLSLTAGYDDFAGISSLTDNASAQMNVFPDFSDHAARLWFSGLNGGKTPVVLGFQEQRYNELGVLRRFHDAVMAVDMPAAGSTSYSITPASEAYPQPPAGGTWPPLSNSGLDDQGQWCRGDGRSSTEALFDPWGNMARFVNDENRALFVAYNPMGGEARALDNGSYEIRHIVDPTGMVSEVQVDEYSTDPNRPSGRTLRWRTRRDSHQRVQEVADALGNTLRAEYDDDGQVIAVTDSIGPDSTNPADNYNGHAINLAGNRTHYPHDGMGWIRGYSIDLTQGGIGGATPEVNVWNQDATAARTYDYDEWGHIRAITDHVGKVTIWNYENKGGGRCTSVVRPASKAAATPTTSFTYDPQGRLLTSTDANQTVVHYYYDQRNRLQKIVTDAVGPGVQSGVGDGIEFTYDDFDRLRTATPFVSTGLPMPALEMHWDFQSNLIEEQQQGLWITRRYEGTRQRKELNYPGGGPKVTATYDDNNRLRVLSMVQPAAAGAAAPTPTTLASYEYLGPTTVLNRTTGPVTAQHGFDDAGRTNALWLNSGAFRFDLDLRRDGRVKTSTRTTTTPPATAGAAPGKIVETRTWTYDSACRVETEQASFAATRSPQKLLTTRAYDGDGGAWDITFAATSAGVTTNTALAQKIEARGRLIASNTTFYRYDANGNLINDGQQSYFYDFLDRLVEVKNLTTGSDTHYVYDAMGRCVQRGRGGVVESYFYDGWNLVEVRVNNKVAERYYWGRGHDEVIRAEINQQVLYIVTSPNGNVDSLFDANGKLIESYDYTLNGEMTALDANRDVLATPPQSRFGFHGLMYDPVTGLLDARYRQYHTRMGQFVSADPHGVTGMGNEYIWANQDPVNLTDRHGLQDDSIEWGEAVWSFVSTLGIGLLFIGGAAVLVGMGLVSAPIMVIGGLAILGTSVFASAWSRQMDDQSIPGALLGGVLDTVGVSNFWLGATGNDLVSGAHYQLTGNQRGKLLGGGLGTIATFLIGGRVFKNLAARSRGWQLPPAISRYNYRFDSAPSLYPRTAITLKARPNDLFLRGLPDAEACNPNQLLGEQISVGRAKTLVDFVDIIQARLRSKPGPSSRFRECAINRFTTVDDAGVPRSSELVYQTPALMEDHIPAEADNPPIERMLELTRRFPRLRISGRMHTHPPEWSVKISPRKFRGSQPGHSMGDLNFIAHNFGKESALGARLTSNFQPFVARIGPNGALQEVAYIQMRPDLPAAPPSTFVPPPPPIPRGIPGAAGGATVRGLLDLLRRRR